jgi:hypothetical protein
MLSAFSVAHVNVTRSPRETWTDDVVNDSTRGAGTSGSGSGTLGHAASIAVASSNERRVEVEVVMGALEFRESA